MYWEPRDEEVFPGAWGKSPVLLPIVNGPATPRVALFVATSSLIKVPMLLKHDIQQFISIPGNVPHSSVPTGPDWVGVCVYSTVQAVTLDD